MVQPTVCIFRKRLLAYSETFIAEQGRHLPTWRPLFAGVQWDHSGSALIQAQGDDGQQAMPSAVLSDHAWWPGIAAFAFKRCARVPSRWAQVLQAQSPRVLHAHFGPDALAALPLAHRLGIPLVATFHGFDICIDQPGSSYQRQRPRVFTQAHRIIAVSQFIAQRLREHGCPAEKIIVHHIGIDTRAFVAHGLEGRCDILFVGRLVEKKGCQDLIAAMHQLGERAGAHRLLIIGDGPQRQALQEQAQGLGERVQFLGRKKPDEVRAAIQRAAVFCVPSVTGKNGDAEGLGMVFLEAQACGLPVVTTRSGGIPEAVLDQHTGLLVDERQPAALAEALFRLLHDEPLRQRLTAQGLAHVQEHFDVRKQCAQLEQIYQSVLG